MLPQALYQFVRKNSFITVLDGDLTKKQLGLTDDAISLLRASVNIFIHAACSTKLRCPLPVIAASIVDPSIQLAEIGLGCVGLERFVYISTACANSHLHHLHQGVETVISERIYSLRRGGGESTDLELNDLRAAGTTPEYKSHKFPFPYSYAKNLTERVLTRQFAREGRGKSLLIVRPSIIEPALREPFPVYEIRGSAPATKVLAAFIEPPGMQITLAFRFKDPMTPRTESTLDEVPVDIVVNRILIHLYQESEGCVHAVAGARGRHQANTVWEEAMSERRFLWHPRIVWADVDWHSPSLHDISQAFVVMGTSYLFEDSKVNHVWASMTEDERQMFSLLMQRQEELVDVVKRRHCVRYQQERWLKRKGIPLLMLNLLIRSTSRHVESFIIMLSSLCLIVI